MKKITLLLGCLVFAFTAQAQSVLFEQTAVNASGSISGYANLSSMGLYSADDFELTTQSEIHSIMVYGIQGDNNAENFLTGFSLYIYGDASGSPSGNPSVPGTGLLEIVDISSTDPAFTLDHPGTSIYNFSVDIVASEGAPLVLPAGTYWIVAAPHGNIDAMADPLSKIWYWLFSNDVNLSDAQFIDPTNFYGFGLTSWTPVSVVTGNSSDKALAYTIMGDNQAAIVDNSPLETRVSLYPNPASDKLHINMSANLELESAVIVDLLGKSTRIKIGNDKLVDVSSMAAGVYFLKLETNQGELVKKFIKK